MDNRFISISFFNINNFQYYFCDMRIVFHIKSIVIEIIINFYNMCSSFIVSILAITILVYLYVINYNYYNNNNNNKNIKKENFYPLIKNPYYSFLWSYFFIFVLFIANFARTSSLSSSFFFSETLRYFALLLCDLCENLFCFFSFFL